MLLLCKFSFDFQRLVLLALPTCTYNLLNSNIACSVVLWFMIYVMLSILSPLVQWFELWFCDPQIAGSNSVGGYHLYELHGEIALKIDGFIIF